MRGLYTSELKKNTIIIAISSLGSKIINFILAPMYSYFLTPEQYGQMDLIITTTSLLLPFICLNIYAGTFRYTIESSSEDGKKKVLSNSLFICLIIPIFTILILLLLQFWTNIPRNYLHLSYFFYIG